MLTFDVLLMVVVVLLIRYHRSRAEDLLKALDAQSFVQVAIILLFRPRRRGSRRLWLQRKQQMRRHIKAAKINEKTPQIYRLKMFSSITRQKLIY